MTISLRANNDGSAIILVQGVPRMTIDPTGNLIGTVTPPLSDSSFKLPTTEFVAGKARSFKSVSIISTTSSLSIFDVGRQIIGDVSAGSITITLPPITSLFPGSAIRINVGASTASNRVNIAPSGTEQIFGSSAVSWTNASPLSLGSGEYAELVFNGTQWQLIDGPALFDLGGTVFLKSITAPGYIRAAGGVIWQWGNTPAGATSRVMTFPIPFPNGIINVNHFDGGWHPTILGSKWGATNRTVNGFTGWTDTASEGGNYVAMGW